MVHTPYSSVSFQMTLSDYSLTRSIARSLCYSWASCFHKPLKYSVFVFKLKFTVKHYFRWRQVHLIHWSLAASTKWSEIWIQIDVVVGRITLSRIQSFCPSFIKSGRWWQMLTKCRKNPLFCDAFPSFFTFSPLPYPSLLRSDPLNPVTDMEKASPSGVGRSPANKRFWGNF